MRSRMPWPAASPSQPSLWPGAPPSQTSPWSVPQQRYSAISMEAMDVLRRCERELEALEVQAEDAALQLQRHAVTPGQARTLLAQVEARARRLEMESVDGIYTSELVSGRARAKTEKRGQLARLGQLFARLDALFQWVGDVEDGYQRDAQRSQRAAAQSRPAAGLAAVDPALSQGASQWSQSSASCSPPHHQQQPQQFQQPLQEQPQPQSRYQQNERPKAHRAYSLQSQEAIENLQRTEAELEGLERTADEVVEQLEAGTLTVGQARTALATVEAQAHRLETDRVDGIYTSELVSGKVQAKTEKKEQLARLERLFARLEATFAGIGKAEPGAAA